MLKKRYKSANQVSGVIDLERLRSGPPKCIEREPGQFFDLTYPSEDLHAMLRALSRRFTEREVEGTGVYLAEAVKGLGKSHALLLAYHLFISREKAVAWMKEKEYVWRPPSNSHVIIKKFTDELLPFDSLWSVIDRDLGAKWAQTRPPSLDEFRTALGEDHLVLIFDELERGLTNIPDPAKRSQNLTFLQMISEEANRSPKVTLFAAIYDGAAEPGATLKRISPRVEMRFRNPEDRAAIVRHRLFSKADSYDRSAADVLIRSYANAWRQHGVETKDDYILKSKKTFPFLPELMELIFERVSGSGGFQGTRGALGLMAAILDACPSGGSYLLTGGHCKLTDRACGNRLQDLDPAGNIINCAQRNFQDLKNHPYSESMASAVLIASLIPGAKGLTKDELVRHVVSPGSDPNQFESTLQAYRTYGSHFHEREGRLFFDLEENENAKVEIEATRISDDKARDEIAGIWKQDLFKDTQNTVIFTDLESAKNALDQLPKSGLRFILSPRRLTRYERHAVYFGEELRNQILVLEPRDEAANFLANPDIIATTKRSMAASCLIPSASSSERRKRYERIATDERKSAKDLIKAAGIAYIRVEKWKESAEECLFEAESLGQTSERQTVLDHLRRQFYPPPHFVEHIKERLESFYGKSISQVDRIYRTTLGYPVPIMMPTVSDAIVTLVEDKDRLLGLQHQKRNFCGEHVSLSPGELHEATLSPPWPPQPASPILSSPETKTKKTPEPIAVTPGSMTSSVKSEPRNTPSCQSPGELRQKVAERLSDVEGEAILHIRFGIIARYGNTSLSDLPTALRGSLTEKGDLEAQIDINILGPMGKAKAERLCESIPNLRGATYEAGIRVLIPEGRKEDAD